MTDHVVQIDEYEQKYSDIKAYKIKRFCELFKDCPHAGQISTPYKLCDEILDKLPLDLNGKSVLILYSPEFYATIIARWPDARITFITGSKRVAGLKLKGVEQIIEIDPFNDIDILEVFKMRFDVVIGNPPFQDPKNKRGPLWKKFIKKSFDLTKQGGCVSLIHPSGWRHPDNELFELIKTNNLKYLKIHDQEDGLNTFGVGTRYDWCVVEKQNNLGRSIIIDEDNIKYECNISNVNCIPHKNIEWVFSLVAKDGEERCEIIHSRTTYGNDKKWMSKIEDNNFKYPCIYATAADGNKILYSSKNNGHFGIKKFIFGKASPEKGFFDRDGKYGITNNAFGIKIDCDEDGLELEQKIKTEKFEKLFLLSKWSGFSTDYRLFSMFKKKFWKDFVK